ncbi:MAG TPA: LacI family DNA-binding transcriptional regulator [Atribacteraceae bacterium]|nr:LacI family DNA-binding transcriptional regulator [Atribacteraceae bacterium]
MNIPTNHLTMEQIASMTGVSRTTVWRVINNKGKVSLKARKAIVSYLNTCSYSKNSLASSLKRRYSNVIGVIFSDIENPFYAEALKGIEVACRENHYSVIFCNSHENHEEEKRAMFLLMEQRIAGMIVIPVEKSDLNIDIIKSAGIPITFLARYLKTYGGSRVIFDDYHAGYMATSHLVKKGHKKIAHIAGSPGTSCTEDRLEGYNKALERSGIPVDPTLIFYTNSMLEEGKKATLDLLNMTKDVTAIFAYSDFVAFGVIEAIQELGIKIPQEMAVVGCDNTRLSKIVGLTTVSFEKINMGKMATSILFDHIEYTRKNGKMSDENKVRISKPNLVLRNTT